MTVLARAISNLLELDLDKDSPELKAVHRSLVSYQSGMDFKLFPISALQESHILFFNFFHLYPEQNK
jgi:hypothetical protein